MSNQRETNVADFIGECNAGILKDKLALALSDAAMAQLNHGIGSKKAKVSLEFTFQPHLDNPADILLTIRPPRQNQDIGIIMFPAQAGNAGVMNQGGPDSRDFIGRNSGTIPGATT